MQINVCLKRLIYRKIYNMIELKIPSEAIDSVFSSFSIYGERHEIPIEWWPNGLQSSERYLETDFLVIKSVHKDEEMFKIEDKLVRSPFDGYVLIDNDSSLYNYNKKNTRVYTKDEAEKIVIGIVCEKIEEAIKCLVGPIDCTLTIDPFTQKHQINGTFKGYLWKWFGHNFPTPMYVYEDSFMWMEIGYNFFLCFEFREDKGIISFDTGGYGEYYVRIHKGDTISLLLSNGEILDYTLNRKALDKHRYGFTLFQDDIDALHNNRIVSCRITYADEERKPDDLVFTNTVLGDYAHDAIRYYLQTYLDEVHRLVPSYKFPVRKVKRTRTEFGFNGCYVYLMQDTTNGYYKIGISNTPEYREKTLQSEKPTIELLASTKYPTRKIAEAIESALHTAYSQQRLRGEWFKLDDVDVAAIIETLK